MVWQLYETAAIFSLRKGDDAAHERMDSATSAAIMQSSFWLIKRDAWKNKLMQSPAQIYNVDETGLA